MRSRAKGQINQVFILIVATVVIVATVALAAKLLGFFEGTACSAADAGFRDDVARTLDKSSAFGSRDKPAILVPCDGTALYLIDARLFPDKIPAGPITNEPTIDTALHANVRSNIFVIVDGNAQDVGFDPRIIISSGPQDALHAPPYLLVEESRGRFTILTEGFGRFVRVDQP